MSPPLCPRPLARTPSLAPCLYDARQAHGRPEAGRWTVRPAVRSLATFRRHNLLERMPGEPFDCIFLKNVLIYFDAESKRKVVDVVMAALAKGGRL